MIIYNSHDRETITPFPRVKDSQAFYVKYNNIIEFSLPLLCIFLYVHFYYIFLNISQVYLEEAKQMVIVSEVED